MITNLVASIVVSLVTNTSERFPTHLVSDPCPEGREGCLVFHGHNVPDSDPKQKWVRSTIKRVKAVEFDCAGKHFSNTIEEQIVSDTEVEFAIERKENWLPRATNDVAGASLLYNDKWVGVQVLTNLWNTNNNLVLTPNTK